jgi:hypothetical protein
VENTFGKGIVSGIEAARGERSGERASACGAAHSVLEKRTGRRGANGPDWYAGYMVAEQTGKELAQ